jgi:hypothetical protein
MNIDYFSYSEIRANSTLNSTLRELAQTKPSTCLIVEMSFCEDEIDGPAEPWVQGPLPINSQSPEEEIRLRSTYFQAQAHSALYENRFHLTDIRPLPGGEKVFGAELLVVQHAAGLGRAMLVVHFLPHASDLIGSLRNTSSLGIDTPLRRWSDEFCAPWFKVSSDEKRGFCLTLVSASDVSIRLEEEVTDWKATTQMLFRVASNTDRADYPVDESVAPALALRPIHLSAYWRALVLRDGACLLTFPQLDPSFTPQAFKLAHSVYLDTMVLGGIQRRALLDMARDLSALSQEKWEISPVTLQQGLSGFRTTYWWKHVTGHGHANALLRAYQDQHGLDELTDQISEELSDYAQLATAIAAAQQEATAARTNALLALITILGLPFGLALGLTQALDASAKGVWYSLLIATIVSLTIILSSPGREMLRPLFRGQ